MHAILVRIGVDQAYGGWNAPVDPATGRFVYVPIPEKEGAAFHPGCERRYSEVAGRLDAFAASIGHTNGRLPAALRNRRFARTWHPRACHEGTCAGAEAWRALTKARLRSICRCDYLTRGDKE